MARATFLACTLVGVACDAYQTNSEALSLLQTAAWYRKSEQLAHWVVVTDCSAYMFNQGNLMFASAHHVKQPGNFTWIVYGCERDEQVKAFSQIMHPTANVWHMKESDLIDPSTGKPYPAFQASNRPMAVNAWYKAVKPTEQAIAIIDPDMTWLRPVSLFDEPMEQPFDKFKMRNATEQGWEAFAAAPKRGSGARYGQGCIPHQFSDEQIADICGVDADKCNRARDNFDRCADSYSSGPPWIVHASDAEEILGSWTDVAVKVHKAYPEMLAEQVSYGVTQMKFGVEGKLDTFWFLSDTDDTSQPWEAIAALDWDPCESQGLPPPPVTGVAPLWHSCATYHLHGDETSEYRLHKDHIHKDLLDCDAPLLRYPPTDSLKRYGKKGDIGHENSHVFRETWSVCTYTNTVNYYATTWKKKFCQAPNLSASFAYPAEGMGFLTTGTWLESTFRSGGWRDVDYTVGVGKKQD